MGEWGGWVDDEHDKTGENRHWLQEIRDYMTDMRIHHTFWCFNENSSDTGGLVYDNFQKWDDTKYDFIKSAIWQDENGVFIGLDHTIPIGANGQTVTQYYSGTSPQPHDQPEVPKVTTTAAPQPAAATTTTVTTSGDPASQDKLMPGDANCDGETDVEDTVLIARVLAEDGQAVLSTTGKVNADCDGVNGLSMDDSTAILLVVAKLKPASSLTAPK
jgi:hypothetical protein